MGFLGDFCKNGLYKRLVERLDELAGTGLTVEAMRKDEVVGGLLDELYPAEELVVEGQKAKIRRIVHEITDEDGRRKYYYQEQLDFFDLLGAATDAEDGLPAPAAACAVPDAGAARATGYVDVSTLHAERGLRIQAAARMFKALQGWIRRAAFLPDDMRTDMLERLDSWQGELIRRWA